MTLKYAFWPGCVSKGAAPELYVSTLRVARELGIDLVELDQATCTGAGIIQEQNPEMADALNARTFAMAQRLGLPLMNIC
jgi:succinate dehydrogenase / fumarate reductase cytochrome b subunit